MFKAVFSIYVTIKTSLITRYLMRISKKFWDTKLIFKILILILQASRAS